MVKQTTSNEDILQLAIKAAQRKDKETARMMLMQIYNRDKRNEAALMWLAKVAETPAERISWLERVIEVNPGNEAAKNALERLQYKQAAKENRTLVIFGGIAVLMIVLVLVILLLVVL